MLTLKKLTASAENKKILKGVDLTILPGELHVIMGQNGSGKSTLSSVLAGDPTYTVTGGEMKYNEKNLGTFSPEERAQEGIFLAFQNPVEIPGVSTMNFIKASINAIRKKKNLPIFDTLEFLEVLKKKIRLLSLDQSFLQRSLNEHCSGGEKKLNEMLQLAVLEPQLAILDEIDSGLDIDSLKKVSNAINTLRTKQNAFLLITHYQRLLDYVTPDVVHVFHEGKIILSGGKELALQLEKDGYENIISAE